MDNSENTIWSKMKFSVSETNFPAEAISADGVRFLFRVLDEIDAAQAEPLPSIEDSITAYQTILARHILVFARKYIVRTLTFLACDAKYHPHSDFELDARGTLNPDAGDYLEDSIRRLAQAAAILHLRWPKSSVEALVPKELHTLQLAAGIYFDTFDSVFELKTLRAARKTFDLTLQALGTERAGDLAVEYLNLQRAAYREALADAPASNVEDRLASVESAVRANSKVLANMDRRQKDLFAWIKRIITAFIKLFRAKPKEPPPTRDKLTSALMPDEKYACLSRYEEPRRSQLKAVIDYTWNGHPVATIGGNRADDFTLADAVRAVWLKNEKSWSKMEGSYSTFYQLKTACYGLTEKDDDPFRYRR